MVLTLNECLVSCCNHVLANVAGARYAGLNLGKEYDPTDKKHSVELDICNVYSCILIF